jgi:exodeoxyribonuclease-3
MKIISWNVNGIRAVIKKGFLDFMHKYNPDIICLQETKAQEEQVELELASHPYKYWNSAEKKGYSGTAIFSKIEPITIQNDMQIEKHDNEGRIICAEYKNFNLVTVYTPNSKRDLSRLEYRTHEWDKDFLSYLKELEKKKPIIFCGDLNVAHKEIDLKNPKNNRRNAGFTDEERMGFDNYINGDFIDTFRMFNQDGGHYTWWSYMFNARQKDIGWRIDYFCVSSNISKQIKKSIVLKDVLGSDHAPILMEIDD